ncbi:uncharacterized protein K460DRAFT_98854 [Cucurbitaria berberidis CBS 394.84]|uniref:Uncharacterized protein n=1 Tax=Cucurbitaria berberidis CBS 394.84 TaxID=1168544 RepID=A0A9P4GGH0_9PLEO|nr:uncharacterized protein K460DRAFT_98854 [Cucurbitaria berberidis CBS 394.84]KAF1844794.1 hypothetical protein K460DRAFT_98854 [Cucurbitaria berberidis CBS 394.84]
MADPDQNKDNFISSLRVVIEAHAVAHAAKDELLAVKDAQITALKESAERKLQHIDYLEKVRQTTSQVNEQDLRGYRDNDDDNDDDEDAHTSDYNGNNVDYYDGDLPISDYYDLYKPSRYNAEQQTQKNIIETQLSTAMAELKVATNMKKLSEVEMSNVSHEVQEISYRKNKLENSIKKLEVKQGNIELHVGKLELHVSNLETQKTKLEVHIGNNHEDAEWEQRMGRHRTLPRHFTVSSFLVASNPSPRSNCPPTARSSPSSQWFALFSRSWPISWKAAHAALPQQLYSPRMPRGRVPFRAC